MSDSPFGRPLPMVALLIPFLALMFVRPFADPIQATVEVLGLLLLLGITSVHTVKSLRDADEVQLAGARFIMSVGAVFMLVVLALTSSMVAHVVRVRRMTSP